MRKFQISATAFEGIAELTYIDDRLVQINAIEAKMKDNQLLFLYRNAPVYLKDIEAFSQMLKSAVIVESGWTYSLEDFKRDYPYSRNTHLLPDIWKKLSATDLVRISIATPKYRKWCERMKQKMQNFSHKIAAGWLKEKQYLNDWDKLDNE